MEPIAATCAATVSILSLGFSIRQRPPIVTIPIKTWAYFLGMMSHPLETGMVNAFAHAVGGSCPRLTVNRLAKMIAPKTG
jgi:hypothetical protein